jgi:hypothetical protein
MKVHDLQQFLRSLAQPLTAAGGKKVADDLERAAGGFEQFRDMSITDFCNFLDKANHFVTTGALPKSGRGAPRKAAGLSEEELRQKTQRLMEMYEKALDADFSYEQVKEEVKGLDKLTVGALKQIAKEMGINRSFRKKADVLDALERKITERRASHERNQFRTPPEEPSRLNDNSPAAAEPAPAQAHQAAASPDR